MEKEFEALECLNKIQHNFGQLKGQELVNCFETICKALAELQAIKSAKPSEALNALLDRANHDEFLGRIGKEEALKFLNENRIFVDTIKQALMSKSNAEKDKKFKALAKEYKVDLWLIQECDYENYIRIRKEAQIENEIIPSDVNSSSEDVIPEEVFNFLKEELE